MFTKPIVALTMIASALGWAGLSLPPQNSPALMSTPSPALPVIGPDNADQVVQQAKLEGHTGAVYSVAWSPDGKLIASGSQDSTVRLWDAETGDVLHVLEGHTDAVWGVAWSPDGSVLASASRDGTVRLWDPVTGEELAAFMANMWVFSVAWSPDGRLIGCGTNVGRVLVFDVESGEMLARMEGHYREVIATAWTPDGALLASGSIDSTVRLWGVEAQETVAELKVSDSRNDVNGVAWSPDGGILAAAVQDGAIWLWQPESDQEPEVLSGHLGWARGVAWSPDGALLATTGEDFKVRLWDAATGKQVAELTGHGSPVWGAAWSPNGTRLVSGSGVYQGVGDTSVRIWGIPGLGTSAQSAEGVSTTSSTPMPAVSGNEDWTPVIGEFDGVEMVPVPPGCFLMGDENGEDDEKPVQEICFDQPFWIDRYEVSNAQYGSAGFFSAMANRNCFYTCNPRSRLQIMPETWLYVAPGQHILDFGTSSK